MGTRFRRSVKIAPGIKLNVTKTGVGMTFGGKGAHYSVHSSGRHTRTVGLPGTGLYYQSTSKSGSQHATAKPSPSRPQPQRPPAKPTASGVPGQPASFPVDPARVIPKPGLLSSRAEQSYYKGVMAYLRHDMAAALNAFVEASNADPASTSARLLVGMAAASLNQDEMAARWLETVVSGAHVMPDRLQLKYLPPAVSIAISIKVTDSISCQLPFSELGAALILAELYQEHAQLEPAIGLMQQVHEALPADPVVRLSLCDLLAADNDHEGVVETSTGVVNTSDIEVETLHIRGAAFMALGHHTAALDAFNEALSKTANRDPMLLNVVRFDRALALKNAGQKARAKADLERVYAADPGFPGVREHLAALGG